MDLTLNELSELVIKRSDEGDLSNGSLDIQSLNILMMLDRPKTIENATKESGYELEVVEEKLILLIKDGLVEVTDGKSKILETGFINYLKAQLTKAVGPLAAILLEDVAYDVGYEINYFPTSHAAELFSLLTEEIQRGDQAAEFERNVTAKLKAYQQ